MRRLLESVSEAVIGLLVIGSLALFPLFPSSVLAAVDDGNSPISDTVDFEDIVVPLDTKIDAGDFRSGNLFFDTDNDDSNFINGQVFDSGDPFSYNGSTYLFLSGYNDGGWIFPEVLITVGLGVPFELDELDLSETLIHPTPPPASQEALSVRIVGNLVGGGTVGPLDVTLDTVLDGLGGGADFQSVGFGVTWTNLESVSIQTLTGNASGSVSIDDIDVTYIPDNCPDDYNPGQEDADFDEVGDACDNCPDTPNFDEAGVDVDSDLLGAACDNCPDDYNPGQEDADVDGIGDVCDLTADSLSATFDFEDQDVKLNVNVPTSDFLTQPLGVSLDLLVDTDESFGGFGAGLVNGEWIEEPTSDPADDYVVAYNGSTFFYSHGGHDGFEWIFPEVILSLSGGGPFDLHSLDMAECCEPSMAWTVQVTGTYEDASPPISKIITLDRVVDGAGVAEDFEAIKFDYQWVDLASVSIQSLSGVDDSEWAIDNVEIGYVPEPSAALLQVIALSCLLGLRGRKRT